jgi:hypothetical protein
MQPKPIDSRHLLDIDAQKRTVEMEGIQHLRSVRGQKDHPADTDYDVIHDEAGRRNRDESARRFSRQPIEPPAATVPHEDEPAAPEPSEDVKKRVNGQKGTHLDIKA